MPHRDPCAPAADAARDGRTAAADGSDRSRQSVQPWPSHLDAPHPRGARSALSAGALMSAPRARAAASPQLPVYLLTGPTGTGKSDWAIRLAETAPIEIVSVDSALVYRGLDIGTAK